jgi:hypothetical protein
MIYTAVATVLLLVPSGCDSAGAGDDSSSVTPPDEPGETRVDAIEETAAAAADAAQAAATAAGDSTAASYAGIMGGVFSGVSGYFEAWDTEDPGWQETSDGWVYEFTYPDSETVYWRWVVSRGTAAWTYQLLFDFDSDNVLELYLDGTVAFDGSSGRFDYYFGDDTSPTATASWTTGGGQITYVYDVPDAWTITMVTTPDGSTGSITIASGGETDTYRW